MDESAEPVSAADVVVKTTAAVGPRRADRVHASLRRQIEEGVWLPGARLPTESELCQQFGVSRPVVREALARLKNAGWIETRRGSGSVVVYPVRAPALARSPVLSATDLVHGFEFRVSLECDSARLAALRRSDAQLDAIEQAMNAMNRPGLEDQAKGAADLKFHLAVAEASGNPFYSKVLSMLYEHILAAMRLNAVFHNAPHTRTAEIYRQHERIVQAIRKQDPDGAHEAMAEHLHAARFGLLGFASGTAGQPADSPV